MHNFWIIHLKREACWVTETLVKYLEVALDGVEKVII